MSGKPVSSPRGFSTRRSPSPRSGGGRADIEVLGAYRKPQVKIDFALTFRRIRRVRRDGPSAGRSSSSVKRPPACSKSGIRICAETSGCPPGPAISRCPIHAEEASLEKRILPDGERPDPLTGKCAGRLRYHRETAAGFSWPETFSAPRLKLLGQDLYGTSTAKLEWRNGRGNASDFRTCGPALFGGRVQGSARIGFKDRRFDLDSGPDGSRSLLDVIPGSEAGRALGLKAAATLDKDAATGTFSVQDLALRRRSNRWNAFGRRGAELCENRLGIKLRRRP